MTDNTTNPSDTKMAVADLVDKSALTGDVDFDLSQVPEDEVPLLSAPVKEKTSSLSRDLTSISDDELALRLSLLMAETERRNNISDAMTPLARVAADNQVKRYRRDINVDLEGGQSYRYRVSVELLD